MNKSKIMFLAVIALMFTMPVMPLSAADSASACAGTADRDDNPKAIYEKCIKLQEDINNLMVELTKLNAELESKKKMLANYEYVKEENKKIISKLGINKKP